MSGKVEMLTEVDENDNVIGKLERDKFPGSRHINRISYLMVFHPDGRLLLQKRSMRKSAYPGRWDFSVGGTVQAGESYEQALEREMKEEIGISVSYSRLFTFRALGHTDAFRTVFSAVHSGPFSFTDGEVDGVRWVFPEELRKEIKRDPKSYTSALAEGLRIFVGKYKKPLNV